MIYAFLYFYKTLKFILLYMEKNLLTLTNLNSVTVVRYCLKNCDYCVTTGNKLGIAISQQKGATEISHQFLMHYSYMPINCDSMNIFCNGPKWS